MQPIFIYNETKQFRIDTGYSFSYTNRQFVRGLPIIRFGIISVANPFACISNFKYIFLFFVNLYVYGFSAYTFCNGKEFN